MSKCEKPPPRITPAAMQQPNDINDSAAVKRLMNHGSRLAPNVTTNTTGIMPIFSGIRSSVEILPVAPAPVEDDILDRASESLRNERVELRIRRVPTDNCLPTQADSALCKRCKEV